MLLWLASGSPLMYCTDNLKEYIYTFILRRNVLKWKLKRCAVSREKRTPGLGQVRIDPVGL